MIENFMTLKKIIFHDRELLVSDTGRVFYGDSGKEIPQFDNGKGYKKVSIRSKTEKKQFSPRVHRLVAESFLPNPENKPCINHKNLKRDDNRVENLEWCTVKENNSYEPTRKRKSKKVQQFSKEGILLNTFPSAREAERKTGIFHPNISLCCNGKRKTAGGYIWKFA